MANNGISITQGLAELKLLDKRIRNINDGASEYEPGFCFRFIAISTKANQVDAEKLKKEAQAAYQSFNDLLKRRDQIKRAIIMKNATTSVRIGTWEGTVAEAIEQKASMVYKALEGEIENFTTNVDWVLSEANSKTLILVGL